VPFARRFLDHFVDSKLITIEDIQRNPSFSALGAELALAIRPHVSSNRWKVYRKLLSKDFSRKGFPQPPNLFPEEQKVALRKLYEGDCEAVEKKYSNGHI